MKDVEEVGMGRRAKIDAILVLVLAIAFYLFFQVSKQLPALAAVNATADDPYDAIGSFGVLAAGFLALLSAFRAFRPRRTGPTEGEAFFLVRVQMAVFLAVMVTLAGDVVALARHTPVWLGAAPGYWYAGGLVAVAVLAAAVGHRIRLTGDAMTGTASRASRWWAGGATVAFVAVLAVYPESVRESVPGALATVVVGALLLFATMRVLLLVLVPEPGRGEPSEGTETSLRRGYGWVLTVVAGVVAGLAAVVAEMGVGTGGAPPPAGRAFVIAVYVGLMTAGVLLGYGSLAGPIGLFRRSAKATEGERMRV